MLRRRQIIRLVAAAVPLWIAGALAARAQDHLKVLATFSILGDFVGEVGGDRVGVTNLVGPNSDAHVYSPAPADARKAADAKLVVTNGLGFEGWLSRLVRASGTSAKVIETTSGIATRKLADGHADPHAWQSAVHAKAYVGNIRDALIAVDAAWKAIFEANATTYLAKLDALDGEIKAAIAAIPPARRKVITAHSAFDYFGDAYGVAFIAPEGLSTEAEPSARDVAKLIEQIRRENVPALFLENVSDSRLLERIAAETGVRIGGKLYSDALSPPEGPAATYIAMMRSNVRELTRALTC